MPFQTQAEQDRDGIQIDIKDAEELMKDRDELRSLMNVPAFRRLILEKYFKDESIRLVSILNDPHLQSEEQQKGIRNDMGAISTLRAFFRDTISMGNAAEASMEKYRKEEEIVEDEIERSIREIANG